MRRKWHDPADLTAHMAASHVFAYREKTRDLVEKMSIRILKQA
jgi:quinol monooxygenase YgiN